MTKTITAVFDQRQEAEIALMRLEQAGFTEKDVTLLVSEETRGKHFGVEKKSSAAEGAAAGAAIGGLTGVLYLGLASAGALVIPGLNLVVSGALVGALAGLGTGAAAGGLVGALVGMGIPEHEAKLYEDTIRKGAIVIAAVASNNERAEKATEIMKGANARSVSSLAA